MKRMTKEEFPLSRYRHCYSVGKRMYTYAKEKLHWDEAHCIEMFVLGNIHDIGYELDPDPFRHDEALACGLDTSYKYANEVRYHSYLQTIYDTPEMRLLYFGDMTVDGNGNWCTLEERLKDLGTRHGYNSDVYIESYKIAEYLRKLGFDDSI